VGSTVKVLLVDDEKEMVTALAERLSFRDVDAEWVTCGLDVKMPGMGGLETMKEIRKIKPESKIIFLTGHGSTSDREACERAGASSYLMKPVDIEVLIEELENAMNR
jgi:CheY-like chemotaxis protein